MLVRAPGKLVLWGEYAVLAGAPAAVTAINRWAEVEISPTQSSPQAQAEPYWQLTAAGFTGPGHTTYNHNFVSSSTAEMLNTALSYLGYEHYPCGFNMHSDTSLFFQGPQKLGLGSSAAVCVATYTGLCHLLELEPSLKDAIEIHRAFQGGRGSGMDVACSWMGGMIRFQDGTPSQAAWPQDLAWVPIWTGRSADTKDHLQAFSNYQQSTPQTSLERLTQCSERLFEKPDMANFADYVDALRALDTDGNLGIYSATHSALSAHAHTLDMVYKPCGAGGGDFGIAIGSPSQVAAFNETINHLNCQIIPLEIAGGVSVK